MWVYSIRFINSFNTGLHKFLRLLSSVSHVNSWNVLVFGLIFEFFLHRQPVNFYNSANIFPFLLKKSYKIICYKKENQYIFIFINYYYNNNKGAKTWNPKKPNLQPPTLLQQTITRMLHLPRRSMRLKKYAIVAFAKERLANIFWFVVVIWWC